MSPRCIQEVIRQEQNTTCQINATNQKQAKNGWKMGKLPLRHLHGQNNTSSTVFVSPHTSVVLIFDPFLIDLVSVFARLS